MLTEKKLLELQESLQQRSNQVEQQKHHSDQASAALRLFNRSDLQGFAISAPGHDPVYLAQIPQTAVEKIKEALQLICEFHAVNAYRCDIQPTLQFESENH